MIAAIYLCVYKKKNESKNLKLERNKPQQLAPTSRFIYPNTREVEETA